MAVIAENISAMFAHWSLASPRACLLMGDLIPMSGGDSMRFELTNARFV